MTGWTEERVTQLRALLITPEPLSAADIGTKLDISRGSVIGKVRRLGLNLPQNIQQARANRIGRKQPRHRATRETMQVRRLKGVGRSQQPHFVVDDIVLDAPQLVDNVIPLGQRRALLELTEKTCHWPIGEVGAPDFFFCGGEAIGPYCSFHARIAQRPYIARRAPL